jgi:hypothetical protein
VAPGATETLTASNVTDPGGSVTQVAFYLDSNGDGTLEPGTDRLLGMATQASPGVWTGSAAVPAGRSAGTYTVFAQAQDSGGALSAASAATLTVSSGGNQSRPVIGSFTVNPNPVTAGSSVTLTEPNTLDAAPGSTITQVAFYLDSNNDGALQPGTDRLLGMAMQTSPGVWTLTNSNAFGLTAGTYTLFARAEDNYGAFSYPVALTLTVNAESGAGELVNSVKDFLQAEQPLLVKAINLWLAQLNQTVQQSSGQPVIGSFSASPDPVAPGGTETLTASAVTDPGGSVTQVAFYLDSNGDGTLEPGTDQLLGMATQASPGVWAGSASVPAGTAAGTYTLFAQAQDSGGALSAASATTLTVS